MLNAKSRIRSLLRLFDIAVLRFSSYQRLIENVSAVQDLEFLKSVPGDQAAEVLRWFAHSKSQLRQDLFVLTQLNFQRNGYFVEFGATNGVDLSNTHLLEKSFGWTGILAEPAKCWQIPLGASRTASIDFRCVWKDFQSVLGFNETDVAELSTIGSFQSADIHGKLRQGGKSYEVKTVSLNDLLSEHGAPRVIDYLSIDTEGSEFDILKSFDFERHTFRVITCEHNFTRAREKIFELLSHKGYVRKYEALSKFDDWYIKPETVHQTDS